MQLWPGCHGVRLAGSAIDVGDSSGPPLCEATVTVGSVEPRGGDLLWRIDDVVDTGDGPIQVDQELRRGEGGVVSMTSTSGHAVTVDPATNEIAVDGRDDAVRAQLLTSFGLPLILQDAPALMLHASAAVGPDGAVLVCGESGRGKSSALVGLIDAGWRAVSEDLCVVDLRGDEPVVWPGPPWLRRSPDQAGPEGAQARFTTPDKVAWDITAARTTAPTRVAEIVFLDAAGGDDVEQSPLEVIEVIPRLAKHAQWFGHPDDRGKRLFAPAVDVAGHVKARRVRVPISNSWLDMFRDLFV